MHAIQIHTTQNDTILGLAHNGEAVPLLPADRRRHVYVVGQTGTGKTGLLINLMRSDLAAGRGFAFLDPHGDASREIAAATPSDRTNDVIYLDPSDRSHAFAFNPLAKIAVEDRATAAANIVSAFKNIWGDSWGPRLEYVLTNALRLLLDTPDQSLIGIPKLLADEHYRTWLAKRCRDPVIRFFWRREYEAHGERLRSEMIAPIQNKVGILLGNPFLRAILCQSASTLDIPRVMNEGKVLILNLAKGGLGTEPAHLLGALLTTAFSQAAEARRHIPEHQRRDFTLYVDEFQNFATDSFATILSEARKWRLSLVAANQHVAQLSDTLRHAVFGNVGTLVAFRVSAHDAPVIGPELGMPDPLTLRETDNFHAWLRLMRRDTPLEPKLIRTLPPQTAGRRFERVLAHSRARHMTSRRLADDRIARAFLSGVSGKPFGSARRRHPDKS
jgi:hypothetical protein